MSQPQIILASASPRRKELLEQVGIKPLCRSVDIDESVQPDESPADLVLRLAESKTRVCAMRMRNQSEDVDGDFLIIGADTTIDFQGASLGKPASREHAIETLLKLSECEHHVHTGIAVFAAAQQRMLSEIVTTTVRFGKVTEADAIKYWETGEPADKAGAYGIQGIGARFVAHLEGSYSNVVGLPLYQTLNLIEKIGPINSEVN